MNKEPKISVIVPVYKAEAYLHRCVDSIIAQTFTDWELLLVDDGSPDRSGDICDEYASKDARIRVFHKENGGVSSARQKGLDEAVGEYTIHADPDDWVEPTMLEELYKKAKEDDADMVICDFFVNTKSHQYVSKQQPKECKAHIVLEQLLLQELHGSCWNKLIKKTCYVNYNVTFLPQIIRWEDLLVICSLLLNPIRVSYVPRAFYHYDQVCNANSIVRKPTMKGLRSQMFFIDYFEKKGINDSYLLKCKFSTKELAFISGLLSKSEIVSLYEEVNESYLSEGPNTMVAMGLKKLIEGNSLLSFIFRDCFLLYMWVYNKVK